MTPDNITERQRVVLDLVLHGLEKDGWQEAADALTALQGQLAAKTELATLYAASLRKVEDEIEALKHDNASMLDSLTRESVARCEAEDDAERYRWLRQQHWNEANMFVIAGSKSRVILGTDCPSLVRLDDAIDAALTAAQPASAAPKRGRMSRQEKINESREIVAARLQHLERPLNGRCAAGNDGDCSHTQCPQLRDGEPVKTGRHCPLDVHGDES